MKKMIIGMVIGLMLGMSTNVFAAIGDKVQAVFAEFKYVVDGDAKKLDSPVLVYEGISYVRTTQIANLLGFDVTYKSDSRTIEFNNPIVTPMPTLNPVAIETLQPKETPQVTPVPSPTAAETKDNVTATPIPTFSETLASPLPSYVPEVTPIPAAVNTPTPKPDNTAQCQSIRDSYGSQIAMVGYEDLAQGPKLLKVHGLEYARDQSLSAAGC